jgi:hypothetical protein
MRTFDFPQLHLRPTHFFQERSFLRREDVPVEIRDAIERQCGRPRFMAALERFRRIADRIRARAERRLSRVRIDHLPRRRRRLQANALSLAEEFHVLCAYWEIPAMLEKVFWFYVTDRERREPLDLVPECVAMAQDRSISGKLRNAEDWHERVEVSHEVYRCTFSWERDYTGYLLLRVDKKYASEDHTRQGSQIGSSPSKGSSTSTPHTGGGADPSI